MSGGARTRGHRAPATTVEAPPFDPTVAWHDVECGSYAADLDLWHELARDAHGPVLDLGAGSGRVALELARAGHRVVALDSDAALTEACARRARREGLALEAVCADARSFRLGRRFALIIAPMQVIQLLGGPDGRAAALARVVEHLESGGLFAPALADPFTGLPAAEALPPLPDLGERDGWALASTPIAVRAEPAAGAAEATIAIDRIRHASSPSGATIETAATIRLSVLAPETLAREARSHGLQRLTDRHVPETADHVGSTVLALRAPPA